MRFFSKRFWQKKDKSNAADHFVPLAKREGPKNIARPEDFILRSTGPMPQGYAVVPTRQRFASRNEKLMAIRKRALSSFGLSAVEEESVLNLIRIKKASVIAADTRGFITEAAAKKCLEFVTQYLVAITKRGEKDHIQAVAFAKSCIEHSLTTKQTDVEKITQNDFNEGLVDVANTTHFVFYPSDKRASRLLQTNKLAYMILAEEAQRGIKSILGENYDKFKALEREGRKEL